MPDSVMSRIPLTLNQLEAMKLPIEISEQILGSGIRAVSQSQDMMSIIQAMGMQLTEQCLAGFGWGPKALANQFAAIQQQCLKSYYDIFSGFFLSTLRQLHAERSAELSFIKLFTDPLPAQDWTTEYDGTNVILDLPSMRVIDISTPIEHRLRNCTVVFAPRAGHHSNIAERVALHLRECGLTRMVIVEQKCAEDIPLFVDGERHSEDFASQVDQYTQVLTHLDRITGAPSHLVAICQPGPLLISTLILNPHLGKTFGSAGSPMHTEAEKGFLTDFARLMGEHFIDKVMNLFAKRIRADHPGSGRDCFDGALQVLVFYYLGMDQHARNFRQLLKDLKQNNVDAAERQKVFYDWYNMAYHLPDGFIRDTYKKIFVNNDLIHGRLTIGQKTIGIQDYPGSVPIWALGGRADAIAPPLQAVGHMDLIDSVPDADKLTLTCDGGHMALFRSRKILKSHYGRIARFMLERSDSVME